MLNKILIANRGECAVRIARTCERLGISTAAVYGDGERQSLHVQACEESHLIEAGPAIDPYLNSDAIVQTAKTAGAQAIHPGYGLLSESCEFVAAVRNAGLTFVGPGAEALRSLSDELSAREVARRAGVRSLEGVELRENGVQVLLREAERLGYPIAVKRSILGGNPKVEIAVNGGQLKKALRACLDDKGSVYKGYQVYIERHIAKHRCLEVQIAADAHGNYIALGERECSVQLNDRKLIEESPAPALSGLLAGDLKRATLWECAVRIAQEAGYQNLGTAEFIIDPEGRLYFRRFIARLTVGHELTELCTGLNLVELQLRIAAGERLPDEVQRVQTSGHAMQARISAPTPANGVPIGRGKVKDLRWPSVGRGKLQFETNLYVGAELNAERNPWLARAATYGATRHEAMLTLDRVLAETSIAPLVTNVGLLRKVIADESFRAGQYDTSSAEALLGGLAEVTAG